MEEIVAEVDRLERRVESTTFLKTVDSASESDSDSSASDSSSDSDSDTDSESEYYGKMTDKVTTSLGPKVEWDGSKETYDEFIDDFQDWMLYMDMHDFFDEEIHPDIHPEGEKRPT